MRTITLSTELPAPADAIWTAVTASPEAFRFVTRGMLRYPATRRWRRPLTVGDRLRGRLWLAGVVPAWRHTITVDEVDHRRRVLVTGEHGGPLREWRHTIAVVPLDAGRCRYTDTVAIDAGGVTVVTALIAWGFYRVRQRRWHTVARLVSVTWRSAYAAGHVPGDGSQ